MIQFNLLPDVKLEYIKARRTKRTVIGVAFLLSALALVIFLFLLFTVDVFQKKNMSDLNHDIATYSKQLQSTPDINKILTIQNQLSALPGLHDQKAAASRTYGFIQSITPTTATISDLKIDYTQHTLTITGQAPNLTVVNTFVDTMKFTTYSLTGTDGTPKAFTSVVLSSFSRDNTSADYTITAGYDPNIYSNSGNVTLTVPKIYTTRSEVDQPTDIFKNNPTPSNTQGR